MIDAMPTTNDAKRRVRCIDVFAGKMSGRAHAIIHIPMKSIPNSANILDCPITSTILGTHSNFRLSFDKGLSLKHY